LLLATVVFCAVAYAAWRLGLLNPLLAAIGTNGAQRGADAPNSPDDQSSARDDATQRASPPNVGSSAAPPPKGKPVVGSVIFEGGSGGEATCCGCGLIDPKHYPAASKVRDDPCRARVDVCELVTDLALDDAPKCHTVKSLCASKVVPSGPAGSNGSALCMLQEHCGGGCGGAGDRQQDYMVSVTLPEGVILDAKKKADCTGNSVYSEACTDPNGCTWRRGTWQDANGMQFGVAPGYEVACHGRVIRGPSS
jgi:hypothetical protein